MNQNFCNYNSPGFDQPQPPQSLVIYQPPQEISIQEMEDLKQQYLDEMKHLSNSEYRDEIKIAELKENFNCMSIEIRKQEKLQPLDQWANLSTSPSNRLNYFCYDDDDDEDYTIAVTPSFPIEEPDNSLNQFKDFSDSNDEFSSIYDDSFSIDNIDYVEASLFDYELVSSEVMEIVILETLLARKRYQVTSELILDANSEGDELGEDDTEEDESSDANDEKEGQDLDDDGQYLDDEGQGLDDESHVSKDEGLGMEEEEKEAALEGQSSRFMPEKEGVERISSFRQPTLVTWVDHEDDRVYTDILAYAPPATPIQTPPYLEWSLATISVDEDQFIEVGAQLELHASILYDHTQLMDALPPTLVVDVDRDVRELYTRPVLALEAWTRYVDTRMVDMSRARQDNHRLIHDMLVQQTAMQNELQETRGRVTALE
nr:hypothetical protein [Tanacetum cinerariifolium]